MGIFSILEKIKNWLSKFRVADQHVPSINTKRKSFKIVLFGNNSKIVGNFRNKFGNSFNVKLISTIGTDFSIRVINTENQELVAQLWEISSDPNFRKVRTKFYGGAMGSIIILTTNDKSEIVELKQMLNEMIHHNPSIVYLEEFPVLFINITNSTRNSKIRDEIIEEFELINKQNVVIKYQIVDINENKIYDMKYIDEFIKDLGSTIKF